MLKIAPSILAANPLKLQRDCLDAEKYGAYRISVDVMDGHFVPDITFGHNIVAYLFGKCLLVNFLFMRLFNIRRANRTTENLFLIQY